MYLDIVVVLQLLDYGLELYINPLQLEGPVSNSTPSWHRSSSGGRVTMYDV